MVKLSHIWDRLFVGLGFKSPSLEFIFKLPPNGRVTPPGSELVAFFYIFTRWPAFNRFFCWPLEGSRLVLSSESYEIAYDLPWDANTAERAQLRVNRCNVIAWVKTNCTSRVDLFISMYASNDTPFKSEHMVCLDFKDPKEAVLF
jgi:hypothetical protein